ncbi:MULTISPECIES: hypothetical protein [Mycolicibacterium]|uniref:Uncharacterized protein n=3 Tax=Mycobacteriaceae TaxID=1762 RepID=A0AAD1ITE5_MYCMB|nr:MULTISPECIES: hypothetical protein [Mycolicibacterium]MDA4102833.1 hypothetical protein [Mycolicibacterium monacense DSM 44395]ORB14536.1 hypothetical protein BST34_22980 [Mycolicibacterium monacense DSM 44395]ORB65721.1 hypothetical protein BST47_12325 [Mycolicibacterium tusciae]QHP87454.1 hypothetical protein EWR22_19995 [Mycolicibacterium monacense DSM 44395]BBZ59417.1 hypothetical protein MMON_07180 [Mycolicibacterium monacense]
MTTPTATPSVDPFHDFWLPDYCPRCNPAGHHADRCVRLATQTEPDAVTWRGGRGLVCDYVCDGCGHQWRRADLWTAECAGFNPKQRRAA